jgi:hypothetical protein
MKSKNSRPDNTAARNAVRARRASKDARNPISDAGPITHRAPSSVMRHPGRPSQASA